MRNVLLVAIAATLFFTGVVAGQQENLLVDLPVEPRRLERGSSLYDAAASNDFPRFAALYRAEPLPEYEELNRLWTWSMQDPIGAFYGAERYESLARLYPGYASYIAEYRIIDSNGNAFYPSAETRRFLLREAVIGTTPAPHPSPIRIAQTVPAATSLLPAVPVVSEANIVHSAVVAAEAVQVVAPAPSPAVAPRLAPPAPTVLTPAQIPFAKPVAPSIAAAGENEAVRGVVRRNEANRGALSRSILLIIAGLIGVGMLSVMLHAPADEDRNFTRHAP